MLVWVRRDSDWEGVAKLVGRVWVVTGVFVSSLDETRMIPTDNRMTGVIVLYTDSFERVELILTMCWRWTWN